MDLRGSSAGTLSSQSFSVWERRKQKEKGGQHKNHIAPRIEEEKRREKGTKIKIYKTAPGHEIKPQHV